MKRLLAGLAALIVLAPTASTGSPVPGPRMAAERERYVLGRVVELVLWNPGPGDVTLESPWAITDVRSGQQVSHYDFSQEQLTLEPGEQVVWQWPQDDACYGICRNVREGQPVGPSVYEATVDTSMDSAMVRFQTGRYFTVGFRCAEGQRCWDDFVVYVNRPDDVSQMEAEANAAEKTLIVSGLVRKERRYNSKWEFTMGPASIELGEVFIEVCDGNPRYVQQHRDEWFGQRWCPWSSYVERVGR